METRVTPIACGLSGVRRKPTAVPVLEREFTPGVDIGQADLHANHQIVFNPTLDPVQGQFIVLVIKVLVGSPTAPIRAIFQTFNMSYQQPIGVHYGKRLIVLIL